MKFTHFIFALLPTSFVLCREVSELVNDISKLDSPQDLIKFVSLNRKELEDKLPMMDGNTRRKIEDSLRNSTKTVDDSSSDSISIDNSIMSFYMLFLFVGNGLFI